MIRISKMTKFDCGCRIMTDVITLNGRNQPKWNYLLKTFVNVCGKVLQEANEIPIYGKQTYGDGKATNGNGFGK